MPILRIKDENGNFVSIPAIQGDDGKSAYEQAKEGGYKGTEEEFIAVLNGLTSSTEYAHYSDFGNPHKVTAQQTGALPITGGTITGGDVFLGGGLARVAGGQDYVQLDTFDSAKDSKNRRKLVLNGGNKTTIDKSVILSSTADGIEEVYILYGTHNKPKASDVGAVSKTGDTMNGSLKLYNEELYPTLHIGRDSANTLKFEYSKAGSVHITNCSDAIQTGLSLNNTDMQLEDVLEVYHPEGSFIVFGEHNKPTKTYNGNGGNQTVQVGGIGSVAWLVSTNGIQGFVSKNGFMGMNSNGQMSNQGSNYIVFENGVLTLKNGGLCNSSGYQYTLQVL